MLDAPESPGAETLEAAQISVDRRLGDGMCGGGAKMRRDAYSREAQKWGNMKPEGATLYAKSDSVSARIGLWKIGLEKQEAKASRWGWGFEG